MLLARMLLLPLLGYNVLGGDTEEVRVTVSQSLSQFTVTLINSF
jgi:hypothetical protein